VFEHAPPHADPWPACLEDQLHRLPGCFRPHERTVPSRRNAPIPPISERPFRRPRPAASLRLNRASALLEARSPGGSAAPADPTRTDFSCALQLVSLRPSRPSASPPPRPS
jgi:hypothetical protein